MSKTLTEKWKKGELPLGSYHVKDASGRVFIDEYIELLYVDGVERRVFRWGEVIVEVVEAVLTYFEQAKLYVENRDLKEENKNLHSVKNELLTRCHKLKEQLEEANEVIKNMKLCMDDKYDYDCVAEDVDVYLEKWGVK